MNPIDFYSSESVIKEITLINTLSKVEIKLLHENFKNGTWELPNYATNGSAAFDLLAATDGPIMIQPFQTALVPTGLSIWINDINFAMLLLPRSGTGSKRGIVLGNTIGLIDSDYQGPLMMSILNRNSGTPLIISPGEYIAQALIIQKFHISYNIVTEFSNSTDRGQNGFGSTK